jgi:hypothetical protein
MAIDTGPGNERIVAFATQANLNLLQRAAELFVDGTFKTTPEPFTQIYSIHGKVLGKVVPLVYALLPNKNRRSYDRLLEELKRLLPNLNPRSIMLDYEAAAIGALSGAFPHAQLTGCFFHLGQSVWRKVQSAGLAQLYGQDADFALAIRCLPAIALLRIQDVERAFIELCNDPNFPPQAEQIADYWEDNYIGRPGRAGGPRRAPLFPRVLWNVHERTVAEQERTNNHVEGWHRAFQTMIAGHSPNIFRFIEVLKLEQSHNSNVIEQLIAGHELPARRRTYVDFDRRIQTILADYDNRTLSELLRGIAYNFQL